MPIYQQTEVRATALVNQVKSLNSDLLTTLHGYMKNPRSKTKQTEALIQDDQSNHPNPPKTFTRPQEFVIF